MVFLLLKCFLNVSKPFPKHFPFHAKRNNTAKRNFDPCSCGGCLLQLSFQEWTQQMRDMLEARKRGDHAFRDKEFKTAIDCYSQVRFHTTCVGIICSWAESMPWSVLLMGHPFSDLTNPPCWWFFLRIDCQLEHSCLISNILLFPLHRSFMVI